MSDSNRRFNRQVRDHSSRLNIHAAVSHSDSDGSYYDGIGAELKAERIRCDLTLQEVSQRLRIRESHLEAIEAGRFGDLPGRIYAIGFVRSYAEFLGADGDVCITMFKAEVGPGGHSRKLVFPSPPTENRRPGWLTIAASVALAALVYGGWYVWQSDEREVAELVRDVPQHFVEQAEIAKVRDASMVAGVTSANASESTVGSLSAGADSAELPVISDRPTAAVPGGVEASDDASTTGAETATAIASSTTIAGVTVANISPLPADQSSIGTATGSSSTGSILEPVVESAAQAGEIAEPQLEPPSVDAPVQVAVVAPPPPVPAVQPQSGYVPRIFGIANGEARVLVRATAQVQIIVKQMNGATIMPHRVMQPGDIYRAPNRTDVILEADRIGDLQLIVDGKLIGRGDRLTEPGNALALNADLLKSLAN